MHSLPCVRCQNKISVSPSKAGQEVECPECHATVQVPKLGQLRELPRTESEIPKAASGKGLSTAGSIGFVVCGLLATACLLVAGLCGIRWYLIQPKSTTDDHIAMFQDAYEDAKAAQLIREYEDMEKIDIEIGGPYRYHVEQKQKDEWGFNALVAAGVGLLAVLGAVFSASQSRGKPTGNSATEPTA